MRFVAAILGQSATTLNFGSHQSGGSGSSTRICERHRLMGRSHPPRALLDHCSHCPKNVDEIVTGLLNGLNPILNVPQLDWPAH
jgi:hypothetical protein